MSRNREILESLISPPILKILRLFINNEDQKYYLREIAKLTKVPPATTHRILHQLVESHIVLLEPIKKFKLYSLDSNNSGFLLDLLQDRKSAVSEFVESIHSFDGVNMVVLHGKEEKNKANILIIGKDMDKPSIERNVTYIADKFKFKIILLTLTPEQYNQMTSMGLYSDKKKILFEAE